MLTILKPVRLLGIILVVGGLSAAFAVDPAFSQREREPDRGDDPNCIFPFCIPPSWPPGDPCNAGGPNCTPERLLQEIDCTCHVHSLEQPGIPYHQVIECHVHPDTAQIAGVCDTIPPDQRP